MNIETNILGADENLVLQYLHHYPDLFVSGKEIARRADGKTRFLTEPHWASRALSQLLEWALVEFDGHGKYRFKSRVTAKRGEKTRFIAPHLRIILENSGRQFNLAT